MVDHRIFGLVLLKQLIMFSYHLVNKYFTPLNLLGLDPNQETFQIIIRNIGNSVITKASITYDVTLTNPNELAQGVGTDISC